MPETPLPDVVEIALADQSATEDLAASLARLAGTCDVLALAGDLGTGKTVFARAFIRALGTVEEVPSPTFTLVQIYELEVATVYHFDLFRLNASDEVFELGIEEAFADGISLIEWPDHMAGLLPGERLDVALAMGPTTDSRHVKLTGHGAWAERLRGLHG